MLILTCPGERNSLADDNVFNTQTRRTSFLKVWYLQRPVVAFCSLPQDTYILMILSPLPTSAAKFSIIFLYHRVFHNNEQFRVANIIVGLFSAVWFVAAILGSIMICDPVRKFWTPDVNGRCIKIQDWMVALETPNSAIDFVMIALPIRIVKKLRLSLVNKVALYFTFFLGGSYVRLCMRLNENFVDLIYIFSVGFFGFVRIGFIFKRSHGMYFSPPL